MFDFITEVQAGAEEVAATTVYQLYSGSVNRRYQCWSYTEVEADEDREIRSEAIPRKIEHRSDRVCLHH